MHLDRAAYFERTVSYKREMLMKLTTGVNVTKLFLSLMLWANKLECMNLVQPCLKYAVGPRAQSKSRWPKLNTFGALPLYP